MPRPALIALCALVSCATRVGDLRQNIGLVSRAPQPSRPPEPERPRNFPEVALLWTRATDPAASRVAYAMASSTGAPLETSGPDTSGGAENAQRDTTKPNDAPAPAPKPPEPAPPPVETKVALPAFPLLPDDAPAEQREFREAAVRAVTRIYAQDSDDPSIVLGLRERLAGSPPLAAVRSAWTPVLDGAAERAQTLQRIAPVLRLVRQAYLPAKRDPKGFFREIDQPACRQAFALLFEVALEAVDLPVNVPNAGRMTLRETDALCRDSHELILAERVFPKVEGPVPLRKLVRRLYQETYPGSTVKRLTVPGGWRESSDGARRSLRATVGVRRENAFPEDPCVMEEISIHQARSGKRFEATECCDVHSSVAVACEELE